MRKAQTTDEHAVVPTDDHQAATTYLALKRCMSEILSTTVVVLSAVLLYSVCTTYGLLCSVVCTDYYTIIL